MAGEPKTLYVAPDGSDANPGTRAKPFATLERARDAIRAMKTEGAVTVELAPGVYERTGAFELTKEDSGAKGAPVVYRARQGAEVRLVGGRAVSQWKPTTDEAVLGRLPQAARGQVMQADLKALGITDYGSPKGGGLELFFNDEPMTLARYPNDGFLRIAGLVEPGTRNVRGTKGSETGKILYEGDRPTRWVDEPAPWVHGAWFWDWSDQRHAVASIDPAKKVLAVQPPYHHYGYRVGQWFYGYNLLCEIDQPGEWYLDRERGILYFWPPSDIAKGRAVVSTIATLVTMKDASHVTFRGLTLEACRGTAVRIEGGTDNHVVRCRIWNLGSYAVRIAGATDSGVYGCDISGTGDGGMALLGGDRASLTPARLVAENNHIHHFARWNRMYKAAVHLGGVGNRAAHNLIHDAPHMAIGFGGNDHVIELNEIHSVCYESNDAGAMYTGRDWTQRGTVIRHNYLHHIVGFRGRGCVGVYLDDMFSGTRIEGNLFYRVTRAAFIGGGRDNTVANNLFLDCRPSLHIDARALGWAKGSVAGVMKQRLDRVPYKSELWRKRYPRLVDVWEDEPAKPKGNVVARNVSVGGRWDGVHARARPFVTFRENLVEDAAEPFRPSVGAEADWASLRRRVQAALGKDDSFQEVGFEPIPVERIGLVRDERRFSWPVKHAVRPMPEPPKPKPPAPKKGPAPVFEVTRRTKPIAIDGAVGEGEWPEPKLALAQAVTGHKARPTSTAWLAWDAQHLYVAFDSTVDPKKPLPKTNVWGTDDACEVALRNPAAGKDAPIFVLRGWPNGHVESSTEAGVPAAVAKKAGKGLTFAAKALGKGRWTGEFRIAWAALGIDPAKHQRLQCNLTVRKTASDLWLMWEGTRGYSWDVHRAGIIELTR
ncbi:MAG: right-handed parallel beta-helix repeat-containing protein [Planctomycetota bacterium]